MIEFLQALQTQTFLQNAVIMGFLASIGCGVVGAYVVVKRLVFLSGGIAHSILGGIGVAHYYGADPMMGAVIAALLSAGLIGMIRLRAQEREDTLIGALWAVGMAVGVLFISQTPGYNTDLMTYLFGNILLVTRTDVWIILGLNIALLSMVLLFYKTFLAVCFDEEYTRLQKVNVEGVYILLLCLISLTIVILIQVVGIILVIALLTLPAAIAANWTHSMGRLMLLAMGFGVLFTEGGLMLSYPLDWPSGPTIILLAGLGYLISIVAKTMRRWFQREADPAESAA